MLDWLKEIKNVRTPKVYAQFGEEAIFDHIFKNIGTTPYKYLVDFGAGTLNSGLSNSRYLIEKGWKGLLMDGNPSEKNDIIKQEFITAENICELLTKHEVPQEFDLLSIDIDGNDYWVLDKLLEKFSPRVIINEFNGCLPVGVAQIMKYNPNHAWGENDYYGASFDAFNILCTNHGYTLVHQIATTNMIFIRQDLVPFANYGVTYEKNQYHAHSPNREWEIISK